MKKLILFASIMLAAVCAQAQLKVTENGNVAINTDETPVGELSIGYAGNQTFQVSMTGENNTLYVRRTGTPTITNNWWRAIDANTIPISENFNIGIRGSVTPSTVLGGGRAYGLWGQASNTTSGYNYGVFGSLLGAQNGAAIYGTVYADNGEDTGGRYAGYFKGNVKVTGSINGVLLTSGAAANAISAQTALAANAVSENSSVTDKLTQLVPVQYNLNVPAMIASTESDTATTVHTMSAIEIQHIQKPHYGLVASELREVLPELVYEGQNGELCINYIEMIPLLVESIKELKAEITALQGGGNNGGAIMMSRAAYGATSIEESTAVTIPMLKQNNPNPFTENTVIEYSLPENVQTANIYIYDMNGTQIEQIPLTERGKSAVTVSGGMLSAGMYLYSLIADGKVIDTKRMILTK